MVDLLNIFTEAVRQNPLVAIAATAVVTVGVTALFNRIGKAIKRGQDQWSGWSEVLENSSSIGTEADALLMMQEQFDRNRKLKSIVMELSDKVYIQVAGKSPLVLESDDQYDAYRYILAKEMYDKPEEIYMMISQGHDSVPMPDLSDPAQAALWKKAKMRCSWSDKRFSSDKNGIARGKIYGAFLKTLKAIGDDNGHSPENMSPECHIALRWSDDDEKGEHILIKPRTSDEDRELMKLHDMMSLRWSKEGKPLAAKEALGILLELRGEIARQDRRPARDDVPVYVYPLA